MKLSHEKVVHLSHVLVRAVEQEPGASLQAAANRVRLEILEVLRRELALEEEMDQRARSRVASMKRGIVEGSPEWDILFRKFYEEEQEKRRRIR